MVLLSRTKEQVLWSYAASVIASMADKLISGDITKGNRVENAVNV